MDREKNLATTMLITPHDLIAHLPFGGLFSARDNRLLQGGLIGIRAECMPSPRHQLSEMLEIVKSFYFGQLAQKMPLLLGEREPQPESC